MSGFSTSLDNQILNSIFNGVPFTTPVKYLALFCGSEGLDTNTQSSWAALEVPKTITKNGVTLSTAYTRLYLPNSSFSTPANSSTSNIDRIEFPIANTDWGTVTHIAIMSAEVDGNVLLWGPLRNPANTENYPRTIYEGDQFVIREGTLVFNLKDDTTIV